MLKSSIVVSSLVLAVFVSGSMARADDASDIQALITANQRSLSFQHPGFFYQYDAIIKLPFAYVQTLQGILGYAGMTYALSKASGHWKVLGSGGDAMVPSILVDFGLPDATAEALQGSGLRSQVAAKRANL